MKRKWAYGVKPKGILTIKLHPPSNRDKETKELFDLSGMLGQN